MKPTCLGRDRFTIRVDSNYPPSDGLKLSPTGIISYASNNLGSNILSTFAARGILLPEATGLLPNRSADSSPIT
jgi:hypothetical protein